VTINPILESSFLMVTERGTALSAFGVADVRGAALARRIIH